MKLLGAHLGLNSVVFDRLLKVVNHYMLLKNTNSEIKEIALEMTGSCFLSALTVSKGDNQSLENELWSILKRIDFTRRYEFYTNLMNRDYLSNLTQLRRLIELPPKVVKWSKSLGNDIK